MIPSSAEISRAVIQHYPHISFKLKNIYLYAEESDVLMINNNDFAVEYEIKVSRSDFLADFKKKKHRMINCLHAGQKALTVPGEERNRVSKILQERKWSHLQKELADSRGQTLPEYEYLKRSAYQRKHPTIWSCGVYFREVHAESLPNKFVFVVPEGLVDKKELPDYAGLMYLVSKTRTIHPINKDFEIGPELNYTDYELKVIKRPKFIHKKKFNKWKYLCGKYAARYCK